jgi:hypothetical protein
MRECGVKNETHHLLRVYSDGGVQGKVGLPASRVACSDRMQGTVTSKQACVGDARTCVAATSIMYREVLVRPPSRHLRTVRCGADKKHDVPLPARHRGPQHASLTWSSNTNVEGRTGTDALHAESGSRSVAFIESTESSVAIRAWTHGDHGHVAMPLHCRGVATVTRLLVGTLTVVASEGKVAREMYDRARSRHRKRDIRVRLVVGGA